MRTLTIVLTLMLTAPCIAGSITGAPNVYGGQQLTDTATGRIIGETKPNVWGGTTVYGLDGNGVLTGKPNVWDTDDTPAETFESSDE